MIAFQCFLFYFLFYCLFYYLYFLQKLEALALHSEDQSLEESVVWGLESQDVEVHFPELYPELSQTLTVDESDQDQEQEEFAERGD